MGMPQVAVQAPQLLDVVAPDRFVKKSESSFIAPGKGFIGNGAHDDRDFIDSLKDEINKKSAKKADPLEKRDPSVTNDKKLSSSNDSAAETNDAEKGEGCGENGDCTTAAANEAKESEGGDSEKDKDAMGYVINPSGQHIDNAGPANTLVPGRTDVAAAGNSGTSTEVLPNSDKVVQSGTSVGTEPPLPLLNDVGDGLNPKTAVSKENMPATGSASVVAKLSLQNPATLQAGPIAIDSDDSQDVAATKGATAESKVLRAANKGLAEQEIKLPKQSLTPGEATVDPKSGQALDDESGNKAVGIMNEKMRESLLEGQSTNRVQSLTDEPGGLNSNIKMANSAMHTEAANVKVPPSFERLFVDQSMERIVNKIMFTTGRGKSEAKIELKPAFLGQLKVQIISENHQVTIRIATESPLVKEMVENNIQQLRIELQNNQLEVDEFDVFVAGGFDQGKEHKSGAENRLSKLAGSIPGGAEMGPVEEPLKGSDGLSQRNPNGHISCYV